MKSDSPRVSLILFCYQQEAYIEEALISVLRQDYPNLQIIVSDDSSSDKSFQLIKKILMIHETAHDVVLNQNVNNLGMGAHFVHLMENFVEGELVIAAGGDDISESHRVSKIVSEWLINDKPDFIAHGLIEIDSSGVSIQRDRTRQYKHQPRFDLLPPDLVLKDYIQNPFPIPYVGAAVAYTLTSYKKFSKPLMAPDFEDHLMYFRALLHGKIHYFADQLVRYRRHDLSMTLLNTSGQKVDFVIPEWMASVKNSTVTLSLDQLRVLRLHKLAVQKWLDYKVAIQNNWIQIEFDEVLTLWNLVEKSYVKIEGLKALSEYTTPLRTLFWGAGNHTADFLNINFGAFNVNALCDNSESKQGHSLHGIPIEPPSILKDGFKEFDCVLVLSGSFYEIKNQLIETLNVPPERICRVPYAKI